MNTVFGARNVSAVLVAVAALAWAGTAARGHVADPPTTTAPAPAPLAVAEPSEKPDSSDQLARINRERARLPSWQPAPAAPGENVYPGFGIRTRPPAAGAHPAIGRAEALDLARSMTGLLGTADGQPVTELQDVTTDDFSDGTSKSAGLAWVTTFHNTTGQSYGPPGPDVMPPRVKPSTVYTGCTTTAIVDARTGRGIYGVMQTC